MVPPPTHAHLKAAKLLVRVVMFKHVYRIQVALHCDGNVVQLGPTLFPSAHQRAPPGNGFGRNHNLVIINKLVTHGPNHLGF